MILAHQYLQIRVLPIASSPDICRLVQQLPWVLDPKGAAGCLHVQRAPPVQRHGSRAGSCTVASCSRPAAGICCLSTFCRCIATVFRSVTAGNGSCIAATAICYCCPASVCRFLTAATAITAACRIVGRTAAAACRAAAAFSVVAIAATAVFSVVVRSTAAAVILIRPLRRQRHDPQAAAGCRFHLPCQGCIADLRQPIGGVRLQQQPVQRDLQQQQNAIVGLVASTLVAFAWSSAD